MKAYVACPGAPDEVICPAIWFDSVASVAKVLSILEGKQWQITLHRDQLQIHAGSLAIVLTNEVSDQPMPRGTLADAIRNACCLFGHPSATVEHTYNDQGAVKAELLVKL